MKTQDNLSTNEHKKQMAVNTRTQGEGCSRPSKMLDFLYLQKSDLGKSVYQENAGEARGGLCVEDEEGGQCGATKDKGALNAS